MLIENVIQVVLQNIFAVANEFYINFIFQFLGAGVELGTGRESRSNLKEKFSYCLLLLPFKKECVCIS